MVEGSSNGSINLVYTEKGKRLVNLTFLFKKRSRFTSRYRRREEETLGEKFAEFSLSSRPDWGPFGISATVSQKYQIYMTLLLKKQ